MQSTLSRRALLRAAAAGAALAACGPAAIAPSPSPTALSTAASPRPSTPKPIRTLKVGHLSRQLGNLVPQYEEVGPKHGVKFDVAFFPDGAALLQALSTGDILLAAPSKVQLIQSVDRGVDLVMVCGYAGGYIVYLAAKGVDVKPGDWVSVKAAAAAKKQRGGTFRIGVPTGSLQFVSTLERLKAAGLEDKKDLDLVNVPFNEHVNALAAGQVDMAGSLALFAAQGLNQDKAVLFEHAKTTPMGHFDVGFVTTKKLARERGAELQDVVAAHYEAMKAIVDDPTHGLAREVKYTELPEATVKRSYEFLTFDFRVDLGAIRGTERVMRDVGLHKADLSAKVADAVDLSFLAKASGKSEAELGRW